MANSVLVSNEEKIRHLFECVDGKKWPSLDSLFHPDIVYERPGYEFFNGLQHVKKFYESERVITDGKHDIEAVFEDNDYVMCHGVFIGTVKSGSEVSVKFADFYRFESGLIRWRRTYFYHPVV